MRFTVPAELQGAELRLEIAGVNEGAWLYLSGEPIGERTEQSTGLAPVDFWDKPFSMRAEGVRFGQGDLLSSPRSATPP